MDFRRSGQLDERRRRVLMDESAAPGSDSEKAQPTSAKGPVRAYNENVLSDRQRRVSELIPIRPFKVIATILLLITAVAAIEALYIFTAPLAGHTKGEHPFAALDLAARGNIGDWFSSLLFASGAMAVMGLLSIRSHRVDDYKGRYRVWWWIAAALLWASVDTATGLHDALGHGIQMLAGDKMPGGARLMWVGMYGLIFGTLATRAAFEIWSSSLSIVGSSLAALLYFACIAFQLEMTPPLGDAVLTTVVRNSVELLAHVSLVSSVLLYARHVHLDAQGRLMISADGAANPKKKPKSKAKLAVVADDEEKVEKKTTAKDTAKDKDKKEPEKKEAAAPAAPAKPAAASAAAGLKFGSSTAPAASASIGKVTPATTNKQADDDDEDEDEDEDDSVSKSDRKRLKKMARREAQQGRRAA
ncbi:hypothetical protein [Anatilimnocola floriformis]|uniref:hypothetical protein n=1 Tax=Anatilimnocola floriformis TaxID=2948575 RepID=UPI0020C424CC|nr:hypothetical protein [Anatilimnocola floriformis]